MKHGDSVDLQFVKGFSYAENENEDNKEFQIIQSPDNEQNNSLDNELKGGSGSNLGSFEEIKSSNQLPEN